MYFEVYYVYLHFKCREYMIRRATSVDPPCFFRRACSASERSTLDRLLGCYKSSAAAAVRRLEAVPQPLESVREEHKYLLYSVLSYKYFISFQLLYNVVIFNKVS